MSSKDIKIEGEVKIKNGKNEIERYNKIVEHGIYTILSILCGGGITVKGYDGDYSIRLGNDTSTTTSWDLDSLVSPHSETPNQLSYTTDDSNNVFKVTYIATWNSGTVSGTIGEVGLKLSAIPDTLSNFGESANISYPSKLVGRLSSADGDFSSFTVDTSAPLTVEYTLSFEYV